ncbi:MAG: DNA recombination protein RmuC [Gemmatimonadota bacterium]
MTLILLALLAGVALGAWQQAALSENARQVFDLGRELYDRISRLGQHLDGLGRSLAKAVASYNQTVGAMETRVLVSARKLRDLGVVDGAIEPPALIDEAPRALSAPEFTAGTAPGAPSALAGPPAPGAGHGSMGARDR